jgi:hypothetical protein
MGTGRRVNFFALAAIASSQTALAPLRFHGGETANL